METDSEKRNARTLWDLAWDIFPAEMRPELGFLFYMFVFIAAIFATIAIPVYVYKMASKAENEHCWLLEQMNGKWYRFNQCTGGIDAVFLEDKDQALGGPASTPPITPPSASSKEH